MKKKTLVIFMALLLAFGLAACKKGPSDEEQKKFDAIYQAISPGASDLTNVINSFEVPIKGREEGSTVTWKSSNEAVAKFEVVGGKNQITITRPAEGQDNVTLKLTATIKWTTPSGYEFSKEKEFDNVRVIAFPITEKATLTALRNGEYAVGDPVNIDNVTVVHITSNGFTVVDGGTSIFVYGAAAAATVAVGDKGSISAKYGVNFDSPQLTDATFTKASSITLEQVLGLAVEKKVSDFWIEPYDLANDTNGEGAAREKAAKISPELNNIVKFEGKVKIESSWSGDSKYKVVIYDLEDNAKYIRSYYGGIKHDDLAAIEGLEATFYAVAYTVRNDRPKPSTITGSVPSFEFFVIGYELVDLTDKQVVSIDKETTEITTEFKANGKIELPKTGAQGSAIKWVSNAPETIDVETGDVKVTDGTLLTVKLTATFTKGDETETREYTVYVGETPVSTIADVLARTTDGEVKVKGYVQAYLANLQYKNTAIYIKDETGSMFVYRASNSYNSQLAVGQEIEVTGTYKNNNKRIEDATEIVKTSSAVVAPVATPVSGALTLEEHRYGLVTISGYVKEKMTLDGTTFVNVTIYNGSVQYKLNIPAKNDFEHDGKGNVGEHQVILDKFNGLEAGDLISVTGIFTNYRDIVITGASKVTKGTAVPADLKATALANLNLPAANDKVTADLTLPATSGFGTVTTWSSSNTEVIANDGKVTRPAEGQPDAEVTLTYTVKLGADVISTASINFKVLADTPAGQDPVTVTAVSINNSKNMTAGANDASLVGLDGTVFDVSVNKGTPSSVVGLYADFRLYGDRSTGDGNELVISIKGDRKIISVEIEFGSSTENYQSKITLGDDVKNLTKEETTGKVTYTGLDILQFSIKNTGTGGEKNPQVRILSIKIIYK